MDGGSTVVNDVATDSAGGVYVAGYTNGKGYGLLCVDDANTTAYGIATGTAGDVYISGLTNTGMDELSKIGSKILFLIKYELEGSRQWARLNGATGSTSDAAVVSTDTAGSVYLAGTVNLIAVTSHKPRSNNKIHPGNFYPYFYYQPSKNILFQ